MDEGKMDEATEIAYLTEMVTNLGLLLAEQQMYKENIKGINRNLRKQLRDAGADAGRLAKANGTLGERLKEYEKRFAQYQDMEIEIQRKDARISDLEGELKCLRDEAEVKDE